MDKREFIDELGAFGVKCIILDDNLINPNEIVVLLRNKKELIKKLGGRGSFLLLDENDRKCSVRLLSYSEIGISKWRKNLEKNSTKLNDSVLRIDKNDGVAIYLYYAFVFVQTKHWLYYNILDKVKERLEFKQEEELVCWLASYIKERKYGIRVKRIVNLPKKLLDIMSIFQKLEMLCNKIVLKVLRRLTNKSLSVMCFFHNVFTKKMYIKYLLQSDVLNDNWKIINENGEGASGCTLIKVVREDKVYFVKGNELKVYQGIKNEISAQKRILQMIEDTEWFLPMVNCDGLMKWIQYDFVTWRSLNEFIDQHNLSVSELELLGTYLVDVLDNLYNVDIVHNDLRLENIMVKTDENGKVEKFVLIDFGCSSVKGSYPWDENTYWSKYFSKAVCGEMRYNEHIVDDATSALFVYLKAGGFYDDNYATRIRARIGRLFFVCK